MPRLSLFAGFSLVVFLISCAPQAATRVFVPDDPDADGSGGVSGHGGTGQGGAAPGQGGAAGRQDAASPDVAAEANVADANVPDVAATPDLGPTGADVAADLAPPPDVAPAVAAGFPVFVAVGNDGRRMVSADGSSWKMDMQDGAGDMENHKGLTDLAYGNHVVVAVGGGCVMTDCKGRIMVFDGSKWTDSAVPGAVVASLSAVGYGNGVWLAGSLAGLIIRSTDNGKTWAPIAKPVGAARIHALAYGTVGASEMFVAVGSNYTRARSTDGGLTWTDLVSNGPELTALAINGGVAVAVGGTDTGRKIRSTDGITWTDEDTTGFPLPNLIFFDGKFMAYTHTERGTVYLSPDGKTWTSKAQVNGGSWVAAGLIGPAATKVWVARQAPANMLSSSDGFTWTQRRTSGTTESTINGIVFASGL